jgi:hypothetical protein
VGVNNPFVTMEWPGILIPLTIVSNLIDKLLKFNLITTKGNNEEHLITFYERNPARRGLDFTNNPDSKEDFLRYAVEQQCMSPVADTRKTSLPRLEDLTEGATLLIEAGLRLGTEPIRDLGKNTKGSRNAPGLVPGKVLLRARLEPQHPSRSMRSDVYRTHS